MADRGTPYAAMIETLKVNREAMLATTTDSWAQASDLAAFLAETRNLPIRMRHQIVGIMVRLSEEEGIRPKDVKTNLLDSAATDSGISSDS